MDREDFLTRQSNHLKLKAQHIEEFKNKMEREIKDKSVACKGDVNEFITRTKTDLDKRSQNIESKTNAEKERMAKVATYKPQIDPKSQEMIKNDKPLKERIDDFIKKMKEQKEKETEEQKKKEEEKIAKMAKIKEMPPKDELYKKISEWGKKKQEKIEKMKQTADPQETFKPEINSKSNTIAKDKPSLVERYNTEVGKAKEKLAVEQAKKEEKRAAMDEKVQVKEVKQIDAETYQRLTKRNPPKMRKTESLEAEAIQDGPPMNSKSIEILKNRNNKNKSGNSLLKSEENDVFEGSVIERNEKWKKQVEEKRMKLKNELESKQMPLAHVRSISPAPKIKSKA